MRRSRISIGYGNGSKIGEYRADRCRRGKSYERDQRSGLFMEKTDANLIIMAGHGRSGSSRWIHGSVTETGVSSQYHAYTDDHINRVCGR